MLEAEHQIVGMDELLWLARADLDGLGEIELIGAAAAQQKFVHHGQDVGLDAHQPAGGRLGDHPAQALGREAVEIPLARRGSGQQRADFGLEQPVANVVEDILDDDASLLFEDFVDDAEFLAAVDPLNAAHALLPFGVGL
jgi:hypothetical protein